MLEQLQSKIIQVDTFIPQVPPLLKTYLAAIATRERESLLNAGVEVKYPYPRLPASMVKDLLDSPFSSSRSRRGGGDNTIDTGLLSSMGEDNDHDASTESDTSEEDDEDEEDGDGAEEEQDGVRAQFRPKRRATIISPVAINHSRNRAASGQKPLPPAAMARVNTRRRSHTISTVSFPPRADRPILSPVTERERSQGLNHRDQPTAPPIIYSDRLSGLKKVVDELETATDDVELKAQRIILVQDRLSADILQVVHRVEAVQKTIDESDFQLVRFVSSLPLSSSSSLTR